MLGNPISSEWGGTTTSANLFAYKSWLSTGSCTRLYDELLHNIYD
jgi:hypothetical protein